MLPTASELEILRVLWTHGPCTVRAVHAQLERRREVGYNTVGKLLQIMEEKGFVRCDGSARANVYAARIEEDATQQRLVTDLATRACGGSFAQLALHALGSEKVSAEERAEIARLLAEMEEP